MAATGRETWEIVGKTSKKSKPNEKGLSRKEKKTMAENMPRLEVAPPVQESPTIYDAFVDKSHKPERNGKDTAAQGAKKQSPKTKPKAVEKKEKPSNLEEAVSKIDAGELETVLAKDQTTFPDNPGIWLKDLASMLNLKLDKVPECDPVFNGKPIGYPASLLPTPVKKLLSRTLNPCTKKMQEIFFEHCIQSMINDMGKGIPTYGYRIFVQVMARDRPDIVLSNINKYVELMKTQQNRPLRCLSIMWALGQAGKTKLSNGIKVWLEAFLPMMNVRALSVFVVDYLDALFREHKEIKKAYDTIGFRNFFPILDMIFATNSSLPTNLQKKLRDLYPKLKEISFGSKPSNNLRNFFPSFLVRLTPKASKALKAELLDCLVECLAVDQQCFSVWRQVYTKEQINSGLLLEHFAHNWNKVGGRMDKNVMKETIRAFSITNEELASQGHTKEEDYSKCVTACKELLNKMSTPRFPWRLLFFLVFATVAGIVAYDVYQNGGFKKSKTYQFLEDTGVLVFLEQVWHRITVYSKKVVEWLKENVPHYYSKTCEFLGPYLTLFWEKLYELGLFIVEITKPLRTWLNEKIPQLLEWVQSKIPGLTSAIGHYLGMAWTFILQYSLWLWQNIVYYSHMVGTWLQENVFTGKLSGENIQKVLSSSLAVIQSYTSFAIQWVAQLFNDSTK